MRRRPIRAITLATVALGVGGCLPAPVTQEARAIADLYTILMGLAAIVAVIVLGLATFMILRYRRRGDDTLPPQDHGNLRFEAVWTVIPIITIVVLLVLTVTTLQRVDAVVDGGSAQVKVDVQAFRWGWRFAYPDQGILVEGVTPDGPELVVPVGEAVQVTLTGNDVVHSFFVPQFLFKRDAIPGRRNVFGFTVDTAGTYRGQCAEFCGVGHSKMPFTVRAVPRAEFDAWLAAAPRGSQAP